MPHLKIANQRLQQADDYQTITSLFTQARITTSIVNTSDINIQLLSVNSNTTTTAASQIASDIQNTENIIKLHCTTTQQPDTEQPEVQNPTFLQQNSTSANSTDQPANQKSILIHQNSTISDSTNHNDTEHSHILVELTQDAGSTRFTSDELQEPDQTEKLSNLCKCICSCENSCLCRTIYRTASKTISKKTFDPGILNGQNSKGFDRKIHHDINRDHLFTGTSNDPPRIPKSHRNYYISNNYIQIISPHTLAIELIHKLHAEDHGQSFKTIVKNFRKGDYNSRDDIKATPHIEFIRRELMNMSHNRFQCSTCLHERLQKKHSSKIPNRREYAEDPFKSGSIDFYGPVRIQGVGGFQYALFYMTRRGRIGFVHFCRSKNDSEILSAIQGWRLQANSAGWSMEQLNFDADPNFLSESFNQSLTAMGISTSISAGGQHWTSGLIERFI